MLLRPETRQPSLLQPLHLSRGSTCLDTVTTAIYNCCHYYYYYYCYHHCYYDYYYADPASDLQSWQGGPWQLSDAFLEVKSLQQTRKQITVSKKIINPHSDKRETQRASSKVPLGKKNHEEEVRRGWAPMGNPRPKPENTHLTLQKPP